MKYKVAYKCQLCGTVHLMGEAREIPYDKLPELCAKVVQNQAFTGNPYLYEAPMHMVCQCGDGGCGLAYFVGFGRVE